MVIAVIGVIRGGCGLTLQNSCTKYIPKAVEYWVINGIIGGDTEGIVTYFLLRFVSDWSTAAGV